MSDSSKRLSRNEYIEEILIFLYRAEAPMHNIKEIADGIGVTQATVTKYLYFMLNNYLNEHQSGQAKYYYLTDEGRKKAEEILEKRKELGSDFE